MHRPAFRGSVCRLRGHTHRKWKHGEHHYSPRRKQYGRNSTGGTGKHRISRVHGDRPDGSTVTESIFAEKDLTVLNIWGTFCGPCIGEMPELGEWAKEMPDNVQIVGLIIDINGEEDTEHRDLAVDITQQAGVDFTNLIANADFAPILKDVIGVPTTLFIDGDGNIVGDPIVGADVDGYKTFVEDYLSEQ